MQIRMRVTAVNRETQWDAAKKTAVPLGQNVAMATDDGNGSMTFQRKPDDEDVAVGSEFMVVLAPVAEEG